LEFVQYFKIFDFLVSVGTNIGDISIWEVGSKERLVYKNFKVWEPSACSVGLQVETSLLQDILMFEFVIIFVGIHATR